MPYDIAVFEAGIHAVLRILDDGDVLLLHLGTEAFDGSELAAHTLKSCRLVELQALGCNQDDHHGNKHTGTYPGRSLRYAWHSLKSTEHGKRLTVEQEGSGLKVRSYLEFYEGCSTVRSWTEAVCSGREAVNLTYVSAFALTGLSKGLYDPSEGCLVSWACNSWCSELQWRRAGLAELGLAPVSRPETLRQPEQYQNFSLQSASCAGRGTWSSSEYLPMGAFEDTLRGRALVWQIEAGGPWQWEVSTIGGEYYLQAGGPDDERHHWRRHLEPGMSYITPNTAVAFAPDREAGFACLTAYRRRITRPSRDARELPVIFNDYMALLGDPDEEKLLPLIDAASICGGEYFCIDAGWYADGDWWNSVGLWQPASSRFPRGLPYVMQYIWDRGLIPGLWLELEVMGIHCPLAAEWPDECFFMRGGRRVIDHSRYQLDFRHPLVRKHADEVVDRLVGEYGAGYIKMDYNINGGYGTEADSFSAGSGLEDHSRAWFAWLEAVQERWPELVIENCASGGMRMDYAFLSRLSVQSLSDQDEAVKLAAVAAAAPTAVTPEQAACWSLPQAGQSAEEMILSMVNTLLLRIHQSGDLDGLNPEQQALLREAIETYKTYREEIPQALPFWPLGLPGPDSAAMALGLDFGSHVLLAVWRLRDGEAVRLPLPRTFSRAGQLYPGEYLCRHELKENGLSLEAELPAAPSARLYRLS